MKKMLTLLVAVLLCVAAVQPVSAADGRVTYSGNAGNFVFAPGGEHSLTDLFPDFKNVMPGDILTQRITVKNSADNKIKAQIYLRSLGAHADSVEFLSQLGLKVQTSEENEMAYMFDAQADQTAQLTDWVYLGTLYSGGEVNLDVTLNVPAELDNAFQNKIGYLDWEFMIEEFPAEGTDPIPPLTGDNVCVVVLMGLAALCVLIILFFFWCRKKNGQKT